MNEPVLAPIKSAHADPRNANLGTDRGRKALLHSLETYGAGRSILLARDGTILAGNKTHQAAADLGHEELLVVETDGTRLVAVRRTDLDPDSPEARLIALADNQTAALDLSWDASAIDAALSDGLDLSHLWTGDELEAMLAGLSDTGGLLDGAEVDAIPEDVEPRCKVGEIWALGRHRLLCGDSRNAGDVARLLDGERASCLIFDPSWDEPCSPPPGAFDSILAFTDGRRAGDAIRMFGAPAWVFTWDCVSCWYTPNRPLQRTKLALWYGDVAEYQFDGAHHGEVDEPRIVSNTRGTYHYSPDPRGKHLADLFALMLSRFHADNPHPHPHAKPVDWVRCLIGCCSMGSVFDPFAGSGTTAIACEQLGRTAFLCEIEPATCDLILARYESTTGQQSARL